MVPCDWGGRRSQIERTRMPVAQSSGVFKQRPATIKGRAGGVDPWSSTVTTVDAVLILVWRASTKPRQTQLAVDTPWWLLTQLPASLFTDHDNLLPRPHHTHTQQRQAPPTPPNVKVKDSKTIDQIGTYAGHGLPPAPQSRRRIEWATLATAPDILARVCPSLACAPISTKSTTLPTRQIS